MKNQKGSMKSISSDEQAARQEIFDDLVAELDSDDEQLIEKMRLEFLKGKQDKKEVANDNNEEEADDDIKS